VATPPSAVRAQLATVAAAASADLLQEALSAPVERQVSTLVAALPLVVPSYYDAAGVLAASWYDELRDESRPASTYAAEVIGDPVTDWIEREMAAIQVDTQVDFEAEVRRLLDEGAALAEKEVARGFRDSITGNTRQDSEAVGWSRIARPGACKFCTMLAGKGAVYRSESTAIFAAHQHCHCAARPEFRNGTHGPEASAIQYVASQKRRTDADRAKVRAYLNENYPDHRG
jgi:hypothetical protein